MNEALRFERQLLMLYDAAAAVVLKCSLLSFALLFAGTFVLISLCCRETLSVNRNQNKSWPARSRNRGEGGQGLNTASVDRPVEIGLEPEPKPATNKAVAETPGWQVALGADSAQAADRLEANRRCAALAGRSVRPRCAQRRANTTGAGGSRPGSRAGRVF